MILYVSPVAYQTNDDLNIALLLQGEEALKLVSDAHGISVHYFIGWFISSLSTLAPNVAWYGLLIALFYMFAYTVLSYNLVEAKGISFVRWLGIFLAFVMAYALLPLLLFQYTIVAGLLALAGMLWCVRCVCLDGSSSPATLVISALCLLLGFMVRFEMAGLVVATCLPVLAVGVFYSKDWRHARLVLIYLLSIGVLAVGLHGIDRYTYTSSSSYARLLEFQQLRNEYTATSKHPFQPAQFARIGWSRNEYTMFTSYMGIDNGPFSLRHLQRLQDTLNEKDQSGSTVMLGGEVSTKQKLQGILKGRSAKHIRLSLYLLIVLVSGIALMVAAFALNDWKSTGFMGVIACSVAASCMLTVVVMDRAVFRILLPLAYVFLTTAIIVFPWNRFGTFHGLSLWRKRLLLGAVGIFCFMGAIGVLAGGLQMQQNHDHILSYSRTINKIQTKTGTQRTLVAWPTALPIEYQSPFERRNTFALGIYPVDWHSSHPMLLDSFMQRFGEDIYEGLMRPEVIHLIAYSVQLELLKRFALKFHGRELKGIMLEEFETGDRKTTAWILVEAHTKANASPNW